jgi:TrkA domain protein
MSTRETELPGIGTKHTIELGTGEELVIIEHRVGHWELARIDGEGQTTQLAQLQPREAAELGRILAHGEVPEQDSRRQLLLQQFSLEWVTIESGMTLCGVSLEEANIRALTGATVIAVLRGDDSTMNPPPQTRFEAGDILVVMGHRDQVERFLSTFCSMPE